MSALRAAAALVTVLVPLLSCTACGGDRDQPRPDARRPTIGRVAWAPDPALPDPPSRAWFAERAERAVAALPALPADLDGGRVDLGGSVLVEGDEARIMLEAELRAGGLGVPVRAGVLAAGSTSGDGALERLVEQGLSDLGAALGALIELTGAGPDRWLRALDSAEPDEQVLALRLLAHARSREAIPRIAELCSDPRTPVAEAAADALVGIGDRAAVPHLIQSIRRGALRSEVCVIEALAQLGGAEAQAYLEMTADGHENA